MQKSGETLEMRGLGIESVGQAQTKGTKSEKSTGKVLKTSTPKKSNQGEVVFGRYFTANLAEGMNPLDAVQYTKATSKIKDTDGQTVFAMADVEVPAAWSQLAVDILVSKYFRKAGVPGAGQRMDQHGR